MAKLFEAYHSMNPKSDTDMNNLLDKIVANNVELRPKEMGTRLPNGDNMQH